MSIASQSIVFPPAIIALQEMARATADTGEGSRGHLRDDFVWTLVDDFIRACEGDESVRSEYADHPRLERIKAMCETDALNALARWRHQDDPAVDPIDVRIGVDVEFGFEHRSRADYGDDRVDDWFRRIGGTDPETGR
jgi:hypothetical protein